uniref:Dynein light chain Tctex-type 1 n=1 Tax=Sus scrofa TaxID=9823 RepID=A0A5G2RBX0_PIG
NTQPAWIVLKVSLSELCALPEFAWSSAVEKDLLSQSNVTCNSCSSLQTAFVVDEVSNIVKEAIESAIGGNAYQHSKVNQWTTNVVEQTLSQLTKLGKPFKYIGNGFLLLKDCLVSGEQCGAETPNREAPGRSRALVYTATQLACVATGHVSGFPSVSGQMHLAQAGGICGCCRTRRSPRRMFVVNISHVSAKRDRKELCCQVDFSNKSLF